MKIAFSHFLSGLRFIFIGAILSSVLFGGIVLVGKGFMPMFSMLISSTIIIQAIFIIIYGIYFLVICSLTGKYIVPIFKKVHDSIEISN